MLAQLSLRIRVLLFFALLVAGGVASIAVGLIVGFRSAVSDGVSNGFLIAGLISGFGFLGLVAFVWLLFDENVAKPIQAIATTLRARTHADAAASVDKHAARYLGDLAPAAESLSATLSTSRREISQKISDETDLIRNNLEMLSSLLDESPNGMLVLGSDHRIVLYNKAAAQALAGDSALRLNASIFDYLVEPPLQGALAELREDQPDVKTIVKSQSGDRDIQLRLKRFSLGDGVIITLGSNSPATSAPASGALTYDFRLLSEQQPANILHRRLDQLSFVVFDCETTGLLPHKDELVQIGAIRVLRNKIVEGEEIDRLVDPGRPIPAVSTRVHHITDAMVAGAPNPQAAVTEFHHFAKDAVIVAHNAPFDMAFMRRHGNEMGLIWDQPILDTVLLSAMLYGPTEHHALDALCDRLGVLIPSHQRHTALGDARATAQVLCRMLPMLSALGYATLTDVLAETQKFGRLLDDLN